MTSFAYAFTEPGRRTEPFSMDCFNRSQDRKRRPDDDCEAREEERTFFSKRQKPDAATSSLYETCGEVVPPEVSWSRENSCMEEPASVMDQDSVSYLEQPASLVSPKVTPIGHKGRSMSDYCTILSVKKRKDSAGNTMLENSPIDAPMVIAAANEEPVRTDTRCHGCKVAVTDSTFLMQCNFCNRSFCGSNCVCHCENCGGVFCYATCSTLNYASIFVKTLCLECNSDLGQRNYYNI